MGEVFYAAAPAGNLAGSLGNVGNYRWWEISLTT